MTRVIIARGLLEKIGLPVKKTSIYVVFTRTTYEVEPNCGCFKNYWIQVSINII